MTNPAARHVRRLRAPTAPPPGAALPLTAPSVVLGHARESLGEPEGARLVTGGEHDPQRAPQQRRCPGVLTACGEGSGARERDIGVAQHVVVAELPGPAMRRLRCDRRHRAQRLAEERRHLRVPRLPRRDGERILPVAPGEETVGDARDASIERDPALGPLHAMAQRAQSRPGRPVRVNADGRKIRAHPIRRRTEERTERVVRQLVEHARVEHRGSTVGRQVVERTLERGAEVLLALDLRGVAGGETPAQRRGHRQEGARLAAEHVEEAIARQPQHAARRVRAHGRAAGLVREQGHLPEDFARRQRRHPRLRALRRRDEHGERPALDDVQAGAGVALPDDVGPGLDLHRLQVRRQPGELHAAEPGEQRHPSQQRFGGGAGSVRHGA